MTFVRSKQSRQLTLGTLNIMIYTLIDIELSTELYFALIKIDYLQILSFNYI